MPSQLKGRSYVSSDRSIYQEGRRTGPKLPGQGRGALFIFTGTKGKSADLQGILAATPMTRQGVKISEDV